MATPESAWRKAGNALLDDGAWHDREELIVTMMRVVPAPRAIRQRRTYAKGKLPLGREVEIGARTIVVTAIRDAVKGKKWERSGQRFRRLPTKGTP